MPWRLWSVWSLSDSNLGILLKPCGGAHTAYAGLLRKRKSGVRDLRRVFRLGLASDRLTEHFEGDVARSAWSSVHDLRRAVRDRRKKCLEIIQKYAIIHSVSTTEHATVGGQFQLWPPSPSITRASFGLAFCFFGKLGFGHRGSGIARHGIRHNQQWNLA